ncbi:IclR family transcriptional regulator [Oceanobacillus sp. FSL W7-1293]|uniref:IclR family transcriptional regulator n=1 Tax=Oceanobacillus sp. FSL W7-1293 TaxID=2921699 RepID=UPI0030CD2F91
MIDKSTSQTLQRGLKILDLFDEKDKEYNVKDLSNHFGFSPTVTSRLVNTLVEGGYLSRNESNGKYRLGFNAYKLGLNANPNILLQQLATPFLEEVAEKTLETVSMYVINPITLKGICIVSIESSQQIKFSTPVGSSRPLHHGGSKKVLLAFMEQKHQEQVFQRALADGYTKIDDLKRELEEIKKRGFAYSEGEIYNGAFNISVPIFSSKQEILAGISITFPAFRREKDTINIFSEYLKEAAKQIENSLQEYN